MEQASENEQKARIQYVLAKYPEHAPVQLHRDSKNNTDLPQIEKKLLMPKSSTFGHLTWYVRRLLPITEVDAIFIFTPNGTLPAGMTCIGEIYDKHQSQDGLLHLTYAKENTFGGSCTISKEKLGDAVKDYGFQLSL